MLEILFDQAVSDYRSANLDSKNYKSRMLFGVQIIKEIKTNTIKIYNQEGMDYYNEISPVEYGYFDKGWKYGVYTLTLAKYRNKLDLIDLKIKQEINSSRSPKALENYKVRRKQILNKYYKITQKLNKKPK